MSMLHLSTDIRDVKGWNLTEFFVTGYADVLGDHRVARGRFPDIILNIAHNRLTVFSARIGNAHDLLYFRLDRAPVAREFEMKMTGGLVAELVL